MRLAFRITCVICAVVALGLAFSTLMTVFMFGFPDSYVTDYQEAARGTLTILGWVQGALGVPFAVLAFLPISDGARTVGWLLAVTALVLAAAAAHFGVPWYFGTHLGLDDGIGG